MAQRSAVTPAWAWTRAPVPALEGQRGTSPTRPRSRAPWARASASNGSQSLGGGPPARIPADTPHGSTSPSHARLGAWASNGSQSLGGWPLASILANTRYASSSLSYARLVASSLTQPSTIVLLGAWNRKNSRYCWKNLARNQCLFSAPRVLPCRYSGRAGSCGITSNASFVTALYLLATFFFA